jgi:cyclohexanone monooxygenase
VFDPIAARNSQYWRGPVAFLRLLDKWRREGNLDGLELSYDHAMESAPSSG